MDDKPRLTRELIALRAARELRDGDYVNLGGGIPLLVSNFLPPGVTVLLQAENGILGYGRAARDETEIDPDLVNAGGDYVTELPGICYFASDESFAMIRGGHIDATILGALQVSAQGDLANWNTPGRSGPGIGGAMDLAVGARRVIVTMDHVDKWGKPKLVQTCSYPLTAARCVALVITDIAVVAVTPTGLELREVLRGWRPEEVQALTEPALRLAEDLREMDL